MSSQNYNLSSEQAHNTITNKDHPQSTEIKASNSENTITEDEIRQMEERIFRKSRESLESRNLLNQENGNTFATHPAHNGLMYTDFGVQRRDPTLEAKQGHFGINEDIQSDL